MVLLVLLVLLGYAVVGGNIFADMSTIIKSDSDSNSYGTLIDDDGYEYAHGSGGQWWADPVL